MNLRNGQITVGEILSNPQARNLLQREFPQIFQTPALRTVYQLPLYRVLQMVRGRVAPNRVQAMLWQLQQI